MRTKSTTMVLAAAAATLAGSMGLGVSAAQAAAPVFDWSVTDTSGNPAYTPAPFLTDSSAASVHSYLLAHKNDAVLAVKVNGPLSDSNAAMVFNDPNYKVNYVFADLEQPSYVSDTAHLASQISGSHSAGAFVGNFNISKISSDPTNSNVHNVPSFQNALQSTDYNNAHVNMANPALYPGGPDFISASQAGSPNIRSALFVLPIDRLTFATVNGAGQSYPSGADFAGGPTAAVAPGSSTIIPWVSRFNNFGNNGLNNTTIPGYQYSFATGSQLLSRNDFAAQVLQYRLRGATSFNLFNYDNPNSSVIGYSAAQEQSDALRGWQAGGNTILNNILARSGSQFGFANLINKAPGATATAGAVSSAQSGLMVSGVYDKTFNSNGQKTMALLLSNLSNNTKQMYFRQNIGGSAVDLVPFNGKADRLETIAAGSHELLTFVLNTSQNTWVLTNGGSGAGGIYGDPMFNQDGTESLNNRAGVGVPEPTSLSLLGLGGLGLLARRRRSC